MLLLAMATPQISGVPFPINFEIEIKFTLDSNIFQSQSYMVNLLSTLNCGSQLINTLTLNSPLQNQLVINITI